MYTNILLSYDGSREGRSALREGAEIAIRFQARTHLLAVIRQLPSISLVEGYIPENFFQNEENHARELLDEGVKWLQERGLAAEGHMVFGEPIDQIVHIAHTLGNDLIVVGHRNQSALARWWSRSPNSTLLERAPCSILIAISNENPSLPSPR